MVEPEPAPGGIGAFDKRAAEEHLRAAGSLKWARCSAPRSAPGWRRWTSGRRRR